MSLVRATRGNPKVGLEGHGLLNFLLSMGKGSKEYEKSGGEGGQEARITRAEKYEFESLVV